MSYIERVLSKLADLQTTKEAFDFKERFQKVKNLFNPGQGVEGLGKQWQTANKQKSNILSRVQNELTPKKQITQPIQTNQPKVQKKPKTGLLGQLRARKNEDFGF